MVALFKDRSPAAIIWLFFLSIIVHSYFFVDFSGVYVPVNNGLLSWFVYKTFVSISPAVLIFVYHGILLLQALQLNNILNRQRMFGKPNYLPAMSYILMTGLFKEWTYLSPALLDNFLVIWLYARCLSLYNAPNPKTVLFNTGLVIGCSILLYQPSAVLLLPALFALISLRAFAITEWLVLLMGVVCPYYFLIAYLYLTDALSGIIGYLPNFKLHWPRVHLSPIFYITAIFVVLVLIFGLVNWRRENTRLLIQIRKNWIVLLVMLLVMFSVPFFNTGAGIESLLLWLVPASSFVAKGFFVPKKQLLPVLMFWSMLIISYLNSWLH